MCCSRSFPDEAVPDDRAPTWDAGSAEDAGKKGICVTLRSDYRSGIADVRDTGTAVMLFFGLPSISLSEYVR